MYMCTYRNSIIIKHIKAKQTIIHKNKLQTYYMYKDMKKKKCSVFQQAENLWFVAATTFGLWTRVITVTTFRPSSLTSHLSSSSLLATSYHLPPSPPSTPSLYLPISLHSALHVNLIFGTSFSAAFPTPSSPVYVLLCLEHVVASLLTLFGMD